MNNLEKDQVKVMTDDNFREELERFYGKAYTEDELKEDYEIVSVAYGGVLCTKKDTDDLVLFNKALSPVSNEYYFVKMGGF